MDRQVAVICGRMAQIGVSQQQVAIAMGLERSAIYRYLTGVRPMPEGMEARIHAVLDQLKEEKRVAAEAVEEKRVELADLAEAVEEQRVERAELAEAVEKLLAETVEKLRREETK